MIGVAGFPVGEDEDLGAEAAEDGHEGHAQGDVVFQAGIGHLEVLAEAQAEEAGGLAGLCDAEFGGAAGAHVAGGEIEGAGEVAGVRPS